MTALAMKKGGRFEAFRDRFLTPKWSRYFLVPAISAAPATLAALWFGLNKDNADPYFMKGYQPWVLAIAGLWAGGMSALKSYLNEIAAYTVSELVASREELLRLIGYVRVIVGLKSKRFHDAQRQVATLHDPARVFLAITQPHLQIKRIIESIHAFFSARINPSEERVMVSLVRWDQQANHFVFVEYYPEADVPTISQPALFNRATVAGKAHAERELVISEDVGADPTYRSFGDKASGSMFAFPVEDRLSQTVVYVVNVFSTKIKRFRRVDRDAIRLAMEVFGDRIVLENRLLEIRDAVSKAGGGDVA